MKLRRVSRSLAVFASIASLCLVPGSAHAQIAGENVNMVSGVDWPGGDPFLQRQNEPSIAVSSANPNHLLAGANDYRSVDLPTVTAGDTKMAADAWQGVFKSYDGGQTWKSYLMPGYPFDTTSVDGGTSLMRTACAPSDGCNAAADPVVRAGTDGMFYYSGITFRRGTDNGAVVLNRFIDLNNKENGDPASGTDSIQWVDAKVIDQSNGAYFSDKPWIAVDVPRTIGDQPPKDCDIVKFGRKFKGGAIYAVWSRIYAPATVGGPETADVMFARSLDCGETWTNPPLKLNDSTSMASQGAVVSVDPRTGDAYVAWRRFAFPTANPPQDDAIFAARTFSKGRKFTRPHLLTSITPFDQGQGELRFRTEAFPTIASSVDATGLQSWTHVAWAQRVAGPTGTGKTADSKIVVSLVPVKPPPPSGDEADDDCDGWKIPAVPLDDKPITDDRGHALSRGHQFMPQMTFSQGRLVAVYYDTRLDHTRNYYTPNLNTCLPGSPGCNCDKSPCTAWGPDSSGRWYKEERGPLGDRAWSSNPLTWSTVDVDDSTMFARHTIDVRMAVALPAPQPVFTSITLSRAPFGERGDEASPSPLDLARDSTDSSSRPYGFLGGHIDLLDPTTTVSPFTLLRLQELQVNAPNLTMFKNGTRSFIGDYIDVQGPMFVRKSTGWAFNTEYTAAPVFHAVWTSNQDVVPPRDGDWTKYAPPTASRQTSKVDPTQIVEACIPDSTGQTNSTAGFTGSRNQNVYTSRITEGLFVTSPQNAKLLVNGPRSFVVSAFNATGQDRQFRFSFVPVAPGVKAGFGTGRTPTADVTIPARSTASQTAFLELTGGADPATTTVKVDETGTTTPLSGSVTLNPPGLTFALAAAQGAGGSIDSSAGEVFNVQVSAASLANASLANASLVNASLANASLANASLVNASLVNASLVNASLVNASLANASLANSSICSASLVNASLANAALCNASLANASLANASLANASLANVNVANASLANASLANASLANASISDLNYTVTNTGNTSQAFDVTLLAKGATTPVQVIVSKTSAKPVAMGCELKEQPDNRVLVNAGMVVPSDPPPGPLATFALAPGETIQVTLRSLSTIGDAVKLGGNLAPVVSPHGDPAKAATALLITAITLPDGTVGQSYKPTILAAEGVIGTASWSIGDLSALPPGLILTGNTISGTPTAASTFRTTIQLTDTVQLPDLTFKVQVAVKELTFVIRPAPTTTTLEPSNLAPVFGETVVLTATVSPSTYLTSAAEFLDITDSTNDPVVLDPVKNPASGKFTVTVPGPLSVGVHSFKTRYPGDSNSAASPYATTSVTVGPASTTVTLPAGADVSYGGTATFTATVQVVGPGTGTPTGSVEFRDGAIVLATVPLNAGAAQMTTASLAIGSHSIVAAYLGDGSNYSAAQSPAVTQKVTRATSNLGVTYDSSSTTYPAVVGIVAAVPAVGSVGTSGPSGTVEFFDGARSLGTVGLTAGSASITVILGPGTHSLGATYYGDANYAPVKQDPSTLSISPVYNQTALVIGQATMPPLLLLGPTTTPSFGDSVTFTASVTSSAWNPAFDGGTFVDFYLYGTLPIDSNTLGIDQAVPRTTTITTSSLPGGAPTVSACYRGSLNFAPQTCTGAICQCATISQVVNPAPTVASIAQTAGPSIPLLGQPVTLTCSVTSGVSSAIGSPGGSVAFKDNDVTFATVTATIASPPPWSTTTSSLTAGLHSLTCQYAGDSNFAGSTLSAAIPLTVANPATTTTLKASPNPVLDDKPVTFTATVSPSAATGTVTFYDGTTKVLGTGTLSAGTATLTLKSLNEGSHSIRAVYGGNATYASSTSAALPLKVLEDYSCRAYSRPLVTGGSISSPSKSGSFTFGTKVAVRWQFVKPTGVFVTRNTAVKGLSAVFDSACSGKPNAGAAKVVLFDPTAGVTAGSTFTYDTAANQYFLNWDTSKASKGCWDIVLTADNGIPQVATIVKLQ